MAVNCSSYIMVAAETDAGEDLGKHTWVFIVITFLSLALLGRGEGRQLQPSHIHWNCLEVINCPEGCTRLSKDARSSPSTVNHHVQNHWSYFIVRTSPSQMDEWRPFLSLYLRFLCIWKLSFRHIQCKDCTCAVILCSQWHSGSHFLLKQQKTGR